MPECTECDDEHDCLTNVGDANASDNICGGCFDDLVSECPRCGGHVLPENGQLDVRSNLWCIGCYAHNFRTCCDCGCELDRQNDYIDTDSTGDQRCEPCGQDVTVPCGECNSTEVELTHSTQQGHSICQPCFENTHFACSQCGLSIHNDNAWVSGDNSYCRRCYTSDEWNDQGFFSEIPTYIELNSRRKFGIEFETSACPDHNTIRGDTVYGCKRDGSVDGMEFVSPVLYGDEGLEETRKLCSHAQRLNWEIDSACGLHLHVDMSEESSENCFKVALAYYCTHDFWSTFISNARKCNYYCAKHFYTPASFARYRGNFRSWVDDVISNERYNWVNWTAYRRHRTVELRNHTATLNGEKTCNWVKAHTRFIDKVISCSEAEITRRLRGRSVYDQFGSIREWWNDDDLAAFYEHRAEVFHKPIKPELYVGI